MKRGILFILVSLAFSIPYSLRGGWVQFGTGESTKVVVLESDNIHTVVEFTIPGMEVKDTTVDGTTYQVLTVPRAGILTKIGNPQLPVISRIVAVPPTTNVEVNVLEIKCDTLLGYKVWPAQPPLPELKDATPPEFVIDTITYAQDTFYPGEIVNVSKPKIWRNYRVIQLHCNPIQFNPVREELIVYSLVKVSLEYSGTSDVNVLEEAPSPTHTFDKLYKSFIINYDFVAKENPVSGAYLIITHDDFYDAILPFAEWKHKKGIWTKVVKFSEINTAASDSADIHDYIKWAYNNWSVPLEYVLLVGDVDFIASGIRKSIERLIHEFYATDHCFSLIAGDDIFSDVFIGRLPANTASECATIVSKLIEYERNPYMDEIDWYTSYTGVAVPERLFCYTSNVIAGILSNYGYTLTEVFNPPSSPDDISNSINDGRTFVSYRGHGWMTAWTSVSYTVTHVDNLTNGRKLPIIIAPTCLANDYYHDDYPESYEYDKCMGEAFMNQAQGAVGYFGATELSYSFYNDSLAIGVFRAICENDVYRFQPACDWGKLFMEQYFPLPDTVTEEEFFLFNILGDPSLEMWTDIPKTFTVTHPDTFSANGVITVTVKYNDSPVQNALVCFWEKWEGGSLYHTDYTDANGIATCFVPLNIHRGYMDVTVTKHNFKPYEGKIYILGKDIYVPSDYTTIQAAIDVANRGCVVHVDSGTYFERIRMKDGVDVIGESKYNTYIMGDTGDYNYRATVLFDGCSATISNFTIGSISDSIGVLVLNCSNPPFIHNNRIMYPKVALVAIVGVVHPSCAYVYDNELLGHVGEYGIYCDCATIKTWIYNNLIAFNSTGIRCQNYSDPNIRPVADASPYRGNLLNSRQSNIYCTYHSEPNIGSYPDPDRNPNAGMNSFHGDFPLYDVVGTKDCDTIFAICNWWGEDPPDQRQMSSQVIYSPWLDYDPWGMATKGWTKKLDHSNDLPKGDSPEDHNLRGRLLFYQGDYQSAIHEFMFVITNYPESDVAPFALDHLVCCYRELGTEPDVLPLLEQLADRYRATELARVALELAIPIYVQVGDYDAAIRNCRTVMAEFPNTISAMYAMFYMGWIYARYLGDIDLAAEIFNTFVHEYPDAFVLNLLASSIINHGGGAQLIAKQLLKPSLAVYPNPGTSFMIEFTIPEELQVNLTIYDITGRKIETLVNDMLKSGYHIVRYDAKQLSTGIYFIKLHTDKLIKLHKLIVVR